MSAPGGGQKDLSRRRGNLAYKVSRAIKQPNRIIPYVRRGLKNSLLRRLLGSHAAFYRARMDETALNDPNLAVGSSDATHWLEVGKLQFDYLVRHGLKPSHRVLDIGCGNLRAGWRLIEYLDRGNYYGIDISAGILLAALKNIEEYRLTDKLPRLYVVEDLRFGFLPDHSFDVIHAHSVFTHTPIEVIAECFANVGRVLKPDGFFDFTWFETQGTPASTLQEDFFFSRDELLRLAQRHGFRMEVLEDWHYFQSKARLRKQHSRTGGRRGP